MYFEFFERARKPLLLGIGLLICSLLEAQSLINFRGNPMFMHGMNIPWKNYGWDFGRHPSRGISYDGDWFEEAFKNIADAGGNVARIFLHGDGRASPEFNSIGEVTGLDLSFFPHLDDLLMRAERQGVYLIISLWSFEIVDDLRSCCGRFAGNHADLIREEEKTQGYIDQVLIPMVNRYKDHCALFAWEIMNEPEWAIAGIGDKGDRVDVGEMQRFVAMLANAIHNNSEHLVTVGAASLKWNSTYSPPCEGNLWGDMALKGAYPQEGSYLDFYQIHYYDWMKERFANFDPYSRPFDFWKLDKPTLIGESPLFSKHYEPKEMTDRTYLNGYAGNLFWAYAFEGRPNGMPRAEAALAATDNPWNEWVEFTCSTRQAEDEFFQISQNPLDYGMPIIIDCESKFPRKIQISLKDLLGRTLLEMDQDIPAGTFRFQIPLTLKSSGAYLLQVNGGPYKKVLIR